VCRSGTASCELDRSRTHTHEGCSESSTPEKPDGLRRGMGVEPGHSWFHADRSLGYVSVSSATAGVWCGPCDTRRGRVMPNRLSAPTSPLATATAASITRLVDGTGIVVVGAERDREVRSPASSRNTVAACRASMATGGRRLSCACVQDFAGADTLSFRDGRGIREPDRAPPRTGVVRSNETRRQGGLAPVRRGWASCRHRSWSYVSARSNASAIRRAAASVRPTPRVRSIWRHHD
jgi:hypothetical protein